MDSLSHQDASGAAGSALGVFRNDVLVQVVPAEDQLGDVTRAQVAQRHGVEINQFEVLITCATHPGTAAVDCLVCVPEEN